MSWALAVVGASTALSMYREKKRSEAVDKLNRVNAERAAYSPWTGVHTQQQANFDDTAGAGLQGALTGAGVVQAMQKSGLLDDGAGGDGTTIQPTSQGYGSPTMAGKAAGALGQNQVAVPDFSQQLAVNTQGAQAADPNLFGPRYGSPVIASSLQDPQQMQYQYQTPLFARGGRP